VLPVTNSCLRQVIHELQRGIYLADISAGAFVLLDCHWRCVSAKKRVATHFWFWLFVPKITIDALGFLD